jgi:hypothetical protein
MIVPENGILLEADGHTRNFIRSIDVSRKCQCTRSCAQQRFDVEFPIRFNFLDTFDGGNLSIQCHPSPAYAKAEFGENFTGRIILYR